jgi:hypothetical protein
VPNLSFGASVSAGVTSKAHQAHVSSLSCQAFACIRPVMRDHRGRHGLSSWFPVAFRLPAFASWAFLFPPRDSAFLAIGLPFTRIGCRDLDGVSVFRTNEIRVGRVPPVLRGYGAHTADEAASAAAAASLRPALYSGVSPIFQSSR